MVTVVVVIHLVIALGLISLILLQKTEGNSAGGGFSTSSMSAMMQPRGRPNPLSRATTILGISFFVTSLGLALLARQNAPPPSILEAPAASAGKAEVPKVDDIRVPTSETPPAAAPAAPAETPPAAPAAPAVPKN